MSACTVSMKLHMLHICHNNKCQHVFMQVANIQYLFSVSPCLASSHLEPCNKQWLNEALLKWVANPIYVMCALTSFQECTFFYNDWKVKEWGFTAFPLETLVHILNCVAPYLIRKNHRYVCLDSRGTFFFFSITTPSSFRFKLCVWVSVCACGWVCVQHNNDILYCYACTFWPVCVIGLITRHAIQKELVYLCDCTHTVPLWAPTFKTLHPFCACSLSGSNKREKRTDKIL